MCNQFNTPPNNALDNQRMLYMYQCFNLLIGLVDKHINKPNDQLNHIDNQSLQQKAYLEFKQGNISRQQYEQIMDALLNVDKVSYNDIYKQASINLNQVRASKAYKLLNNSNN